MRRARRASTPIAAALVALAFGIAGLPRTPLVEHEHAGGEHAHRHAEEATIADLLAWVERETHDHDHGRDHGLGVGLGQGHGHGHADGAGHAHAGRPHEHGDVAARDRRAVADADTGGAQSRVAGDTDGPELASTRAAATRHAHWQSSHHVAARTALPLLFVSQPVVRAAAPAAAEPAHALIASLRARSPPSRTV